MNQEGDAMPPSVLAIGHSKRPPIMMQHLAWSLIIGVLIVGIGLVWLFGAVDRLAQTA